ncbi:DUF4214 domain-containing protein [Sulfitobacter sp. M368]|uniref:DUF4214 domain-containing protein n=1 Tax=Sulfitobacter sp. M368 TaxID=2867021 RepID=UPI0021A565D9|nr:DUF4214 domain-containing protein [Sulfitobacter sp. M368]UWR16020.1 DUF4214 domain-containing protein [Sulfitobacter sp. M368]
MTTYTIPAQLIRSNAYTGSLVGTETTELVLVTADTETGFSYSIEYDAFGNYSHTNIDKNVFSATYLDGAGRLYANDPGMVFDVKWGGNNFSTLFFSQTFTGGELQEVLVLLGGATLPEFTGIAAVEAWIEAFDEAAIPRKGPFTPGQHIPFDAPAGTQVTEDDFIVGSPGPDPISAGIGNDTIDPGAGHDTIDGGAGDDTVLYAGDQSSYTLTLSAEATTITNRLSSGTDIDTLIDVEFLDFGTEMDVFGGQPMHLDIFDGPASLNAEEFSEIVELYVAYFNRAPDALGLFFWAGKYAEGLSIADMAASFFTQQETQETYAAVMDDAGNLTDVSAFVTAVYQNVLGRQADQAGFDFWVDVLENSPDVTPPNFILAIIQGAKFPADPVPQSYVDQAYLENKSDIGAYFAVIKGMSEVGNASTAMQLFDGSDDSLLAAKNAIDAFHVSATGPTDGEFLMPLVGVIDDPFAFV